MRPRRDLPRDTPVETPAVLVEDDQARPRKPTKQDLEWEAQAAQYKADGYNSGVIARKMIQVHGMGEAQAAEVVGRLFGKKVNPRAGDTTTAVLGGLAMVVVGLGSAVVLFMIVGLRFLSVMVFVYAVLLGLAGKGATQVIIALVNSSSNEPLRNKLSQPQEELASRELLEPHQADLDRIDLDD